MSVTPEANISLSPFTTWKIGGPAEWFTAPETEEELLEAVNWARDRRLKFHVLGRGSNVLIPDEGIRGLVICTRRLTSGAGGHGEQLPLSQDKQAHFIECTAGMSLPRLSKEVAALGYSGYEFYIGIPGTVGGAVVMNAGFGPGDERQTANRCVEIQTLDETGNRSWRAYADFNPVYRHTDLLENGNIVLRARFLLDRKSTRETIRAETAQQLAMRKSKQPLTRPTAGSVFRGTAERIPAAVYIDRCGLKGFKMGGAVVSEKHANWIENTGGAKAKDVMQLIRHVQKVVMEREGVHLEPEVRFLH